MDSLKARFCSLTRLDLTANENMLLFVYNKAVVKSKLVILETNSESYLLRHSFQAHSGTKIQHQKYFVFMARTVWNRAVKCWMTITSQSTDWDFAFVRSSSSSSLKRCSLSSVVVVSSISSFTSKLSWLDWNKWAVLTKVKFLCRTFLLVFVTSSLTI